LGCWGRLRWGLGLNLLVDFAGGGVRQSTGRSDFCGWVCILEMIGELVR
jgi:hypothetical protein